MMPTQAQQKALTDAVISIDDRMGRRDGCWVLRSSCVDICDVVVVLLLELKAGSDLDDGESTMKGRALRAR